VAAPYGIAFQQRVHRLRGGVGNQFNGLCTDLGDQLRDHVHHARGHSVAVFVGGGHHRAASEFTRNGVDRHCLGEGAANVGAYPDTHRASRARRGRTINNHTAPSA
jgi:hypothetical protein